MDSAPITGKLPYKYDDGTTVGNALIYMDKWLQMNPFVSYLQANAEKHQR